MSLSWKTDKGIQRWMKFMRKYENYKKHNKKGVLEGRHAALDSGECKQDISKFAENSKILLFRVKLWKKTRSTETKSQD